MNRSSPPPPARHSRLVHGSPVYYGWVVLAVGTLGTIMTSPGQTYAVSIFIEGFIADLELSRSLVSSLYTGSTLVAGFSLPYVGRLIDRRGARATMTGIAALFGGACLYMGFVSNAVTLALGFLLIRLLGQGSLTLASTTAINRWWVRRRGTVNGISGLSFALLGTGGFPVLINALIPALGWRPTYMILGLGLWVLMVPLAATFVRETPEDYGLEPDGGRGPGPLNARVPAAEENWSAAEALRTPAFWIAALGLSSIALFSTGLFFHMVSIFQDNGLPADAAAIVYVPIALSNALFTLTSGVLADRLPVRRMLAAALVLLTAVLWLAQALNGVALAFLYGVLLGAISGLSRTISGVVWAKFYGRAHLGAIAGTATTIMVFGSALGPLPLGVARDLLGSYHLALTISGFVPLALAVAALFIKRPRKAA